MEIRKWRGKKNLTLCFLRLRHPRNKSWGFQETHKVGGGLGGLFDLGDAADGIMGGVELIGENVGVGVDDAEEIIDGVRDGFDFGGGERIETARIVRELHRHTLSESRLAESVALDGLDDSVLERGGVDFVEEK